MPPVINLITVVEADVFNAGSSNWLALTDAEKSAFIFNASLYMQTYWTCEDVDWNDETTLTQDQKMACAYYAEASRLELLFATLESEPITYGRLVERTNKIGSLTETLRWSHIGSSNTDDPLELINSLMGLECTLKSANSSSAGLTRV